MKSGLSIDITSYIATKAALVEQQLSSLIPVQSCDYEKLFLAARYSLLGGGKRLRPILAIAAAETFGKKDDVIVPTACALEMIHVYSLVHDDLPCMDDDDFRRGKPSLHCAFDEATAVLTGDYLLTRAFEVIANDTGLSSSQKISLIQLLTHYAGSHGMIGGQIMDIQTEGMSINLELIEQIHCYKTGALIIASILSGAIVANATAIEMESLRLFGHHVGLAFQVIDDVIDVLESEQKHGKKVASDTCNNKTTYVTLLGIDEAKQVAFDLYQRSLDHLEKIDKDTVLLREIAKRLVYRNL